MKFRILSVIVILASIFVTVSACTGGDSETRRLLQQNEQKWAEQSKLFNQNYIYTIRIGCFCPESITAPVVVTVLSGNTDSVVYQSDGQPATNEIFGKINTVEDLFKIITDAIDQKADKLTVEYDANLGYPKSISIDPIENAVDEEIAYNILDFAIMK